MTLNEQYVAGALLMEEFAIFAIDGIVTAEDFQSEPCRVVYEAAKALSSEGRTVDPASIMEWARRNEKTLTVDFLKQSMEFVPQGGSVSEYARRMAEEARTRKIKELATQIQLDTTSTADELLDRLQTMAAVQEEKRTSKPLLICAADVPYEPPRWTIKPYLQRGKGTLLQGDNGTGKTVLACGLVALISSGRSIPGLEVVTPGDVIVLSVEDDLPVLRGRIEASGGDLSKCHFMSEASQMTLTSPELEQAVKQVDAKMIVFDPLQAFLGADIDMFRANETRPALAKLFEMCDHNDCACLILGHNGKNTFNKSAVNLALGSVDIPASMRSIIHLIENPENKEERLAIHVKCSNAPKGKTLVYGISDRGGVEWHGFSDFSMDDLEVAKKRKETGVPYENEPLVQVFNQLIADRPAGGFWSYQDLKSEGAKILGFPPYDDLKDLRAKLNGTLSRELQKRCGLIVTYGAKGRGNVRGIHIERYIVPDSYQTKMDAG